MTVLPYRSTSGHGPSCTLENWCGAHTPSYVVGVPHWGSHFTDLASSLLKLECKIFQRKRCLSWWESLSLPFPLKFLITFPSYWNALTSNGLSGGQGFSEPCGPWTGGMYLWRGGDWVQVPSQCAFLLSCRWKPLHLVGWQSQREALLLGRLWAWNSEMCLRHRAQLHGPQILLQLWRGLQAVVSAGARRASSLPSLPGGQTN